MTDLSVLEGPLVKRITGVLYSIEEEERFTWALEKLRTLWGRSDIVSNPMPFTATDYYRDIAPRLLRRFVSFEGLTSAGGLADWKRQAIALETESRAPRAINVDPGYVDGARLVLASTKDHAHRVYLRDGIFAEVTLRFRSGKWTPFDYTYPDFAGDLYDEFLTTARKAWLKGRVLFK
ncbi:MAG: DUF4416 family protein [Synergistaceae bacterium]|nr:DUF4416 family protein [Synergistaceae bacterium]